MNALLKPLALALLISGMSFAQAQTNVQMPAGAGPGVHGADSPFPPLKARADALSWEMLTDVKMQSSKGAMVPVFTPTQVALDQKVQRVQGFMMPLEPGDKQKHFLLTSVPMTCSFCVPGGPESMVEVKTKVPVKYTLDAVLVEGKFAVLRDDSYGLFYRMTDAVQAK
jgi:hypothetical protein